MNPFIIKKNVGNLTIHTNNYHYPGTICAIVNMICLIIIVRKQINHVNLKAKFDKKFELCPLYLDNGNCWYELSNFRHFS